MIKCNKCNSTNVKIDFSAVYTSIPARYGYCCQACGEVGYVNCGEVDRNEFTCEGYQKYPRPEINLNSNLNRETIDETETTKNENRGEFGLTGWICPKCGRCYSPFTSMCSYCCNNMNTITCYDGTFETNLDRTVKY